VIVFFTAGLALSEKAGIEWQASLITSQRRSQQAGPKASRAQRLGDRQAGEEI
jgi:hypothetical protein